MHHSQHDASQLLILPSPHSSQLQHRRSQCAFVVVVVTIANEKTIEKRNKNIFIGLRSIFILFFLVFCLLYCLALTAINQQGNEYGLIIRIEKWNETIAIVLSMRPTGVEKTFNLLSFRSSISSSFVNSLFAVIFGSTTPCWRYMPIGKSTSPIPSCSNLVDIRNSIRYESQQNGKSTGRSHKKSTIQAFVNSLLWSLPFANSFESSYALQTNRDYLLSLSLPLCISIYFDSI